MRFTKKILTMATCAVMAASSMVGMSASAVTPANNLSEITNDEGFKSCANVLLNNSSTLGIEENMFNAVVGKPFSVASIDANMNISYGNSNIIYPIICNDDIVAMITARECNGEYNFSVSDGFSDGLNDALSNSTELALASDMYGNIYSITNNNSINVIYSAAEENIINCSFEFDAINDFNNVVSEEYLSSQSKSLIDWYDRTRAVTTNILSDYPSLSQGGANCWAYVLLSMAKYKISSNYTIERVYNAHHAVNGTDAGATLSEMYNTAVYMFTDYSPQKTTSKLSATQITRNISQGLPVCIKGSKVTGSGAAHAVALIGYELNGSTMTGYYVMNPQEGNTEYNTYSSSTCYFNNSSGTVQYEWNGTITLNGTL